MDPIRTLIVDDEPLARENLRIRLKEHREFVISGECENGREAIAMIRETRPDLLFLDIKMPDMSGFELLESLPAEMLPAVVFVTAYDRYALEAFRVHALDYLLKPFEEERFAETIHVCRRRIAEMRSADRGEDRSEEPSYQLSDGTPGGAASGDAAVRSPACRLDRLIIKGNGRVLFLKLCCVESIEAYGDYVRAHVGGKSYLLRKTMNEVETRLDPQAFARISRSAIVNLDSIEELEPLCRGEYQVRLASGRRLKLTRTHREKLERSLGDRI